MLLSLTIHNFYSHKHSEFTFSEGTNVLIGLSDSGKSSVLKALNWVFFNTPSGNSFQRWGTNETWVEVVFVENENKHIIRRELVKGKNVYHMDNYTPFTAFGTTVPEEIQKVLNINDVNVQSQISPHFLLSTTPGEVAKHFNKVARLDEIDRATTNINSWINNISQNIKYKKSDLKKNVEKLGKFTYLTKLESEIEVLEDMQKQEMQLRSNFKQLTKLESKIGDTQFEIESYLEIISVEKPINELISFFSAKKEKEIKHSQLKRNIHSIENIQSNIEKQEKIIMISPLVDTLLNWYNILREKTKEINKLGNLFESIENKKAEVDYSESTYNRLHKQLDNNMPNNCPFCSKPI